MKPAFSPSLMCMDLTKFREQIETLNRRADLYHVDIMDGHYVKNLTLSPFFIEQLSKVATIPIDAHLMAEKPNDFLVDACIDAGASIISIHPEVVHSELFRTIAHIKKRGCQVGVVLNPATPLAIIKPFAHLIDKLTIMTIDPGFAGQPFLTEMVEKIADAKRFRAEQGLAFTLEVDGSCNEKTFKQLVQAGNETFIVGTSGLFGLDHDLSTAWEKMKAIFSQQTEGVYF